MRKQLYNMKNSYCTHTLKLVFNIGLRSILDNLVHISMCCDIFMIMLQESVMDLLFFLKGLEGLSFILNL